MSCAQVMYQAYTPYFAYPAQRVPHAAPAPSQQDMAAAAAPYEAKKFGVAKVHQEPRTPATAAAAASATATRSSTSPGHNNNGCSTSSSSPPVASSASASSGPRTSSVQCVKETIKSEANVAPEAQYISANCVLFTYYSGDISSVVDEHFSRALSQQSAYEAGKGLLSKGFYQHCDGECCGYGVKSGRHLASSRPDASPMAQRNFPPSFWNSNYQHQHHHHHHHHHHSTASSSLGSLGHAHSHHPHNISHGHELTYSTDPYHHSAGLHHHTVPQTDPWHYPGLTSQSTNPYSHRSHELAYSSVAVPVGVPSTSRFNAAQYSPLLLQPPPRSARLANAVAAAGQCAAAAAAAAAAALGKAPPPPPTEPWAAAGRYHDADMGHLDAANYSYSAIGAMPGLEGPVQDSAKDLYWF